jgi:hypothetical protein
MEDTYTSRRQKKKKKMTTKRKEISVHHQIPTAMAVDHLSLSLSLSQGECQRWRRSFTTKPDYSYHHHHHFFCFFFFCYFFLYCCGDLEKLTHKVE